MPQMPQMPQKSQKVIEVLVPQKTTIDVWLASDGTSYSTQEYAIAHETKIEETKVLNKISIMGDDRLARIMGVTMPDYDFAVWIKVQNQRDVDLIIKKYRLDITKLKPRDVDNWNPDDIWNNWFLYVNTGSYTIIGGHKEIYTIKGIENILLEERSELEEQLDLIQGMKTNSLYFP